MPTTISTGRRCCKFASITFGFIAVFFIIGGTVLVVQNKGQGQYGVIVVDFNERYDIYGGGVAMIVFGAIFAIITLVTAGIAYSVNKKESGNDQPQLPQSVAQGETNGQSTRYAVQPIFGETGTTDLPPYTVHNVIHPFLNSSSCDRTKYRCVVASAPPMPVIDEYEDVPMK